MKILLGGALGRMGREVTLAAEGQIAFGVDVAYNGQPCEYPVFNGYEQFTGEADVVIDFSRPDALPELLNLAVTKKMPVVLCTTGYTDVEIESIRKAAETIPILRSANMSLGVNVLQELVSMAARTLEGYDIEIVEKHHRMKVDSPSGTALMLTKLPKTKKAPKQSLYLAAMAVRKSAPAAKLGFMPFAAAL